MTYPEFPCSVPGCDGNTSVQTDLEKRYEVVLCGPHYDNFDQAAMDKGAALWLAKMDITPGEPWAEIVSVCAECAKQLSTVDYLCTPCRMGWSDEYKGPWK